MRPRGLALDGDGHLLISDELQHRIFRLHLATARLTLVAGSGVPDFRDGFGDVACFSAPCGLALDTRGQILVADARNNSVRRVTEARLLTEWCCALELFARPMLRVLTRIVAEFVGLGVVTTVAGTGHPAFVDDCSAARAAFSGPCGVLATQDDRIIVADTNNHRIRVIEPAATTSAATSELDSAAANPVRDAASAS